MCNRGWRSLIVTLGLFTEMMVQAGVTAERTRIIFRQSQREASLTLVNLNAYPVITQVWVDDGLLDREPDTVQAPFIVLPPIFRLDSQGQRSLRLLYTGIPLPRDRESLYWLNIYEIPPQPKEWDQVEALSMMAVTMRIQMKLFYRPQGLEPSADTAAQHLVFGLEAGHLRLNNPTPYYITLAALDLLLGESHWSLSPMLLPPFSTQWKKLPDTFPQAQNGAVRFTWIDDEGGLRDEQINIQPPYSPGN